jgi:hypothetical protein
MNDSKLSHRKISEDTGINRTCLRRFRDGASMTGENIDRLAAYYGLTLVLAPEDVRREKRNH